MTTKKFSLKDNPIFASTVVPRPEGSKKTIPPSGVIPPPLVKEKERGRALPRERVKKEGPAVTPVKRNKVLLKNKILVAVGAILLSLIIADNIKFFSQRTREGGEPLPREAEVKEETVESPPKEENGPPAEDKELSLSPLLRKDPLLLPGREKPETSPLPTPSPEEKISAVETREKPEEKEWSLTAILYSEVSSRAIINHEIVREGDTLWKGEVKVLRIMPKKVILSREGETFTLRIETITSRKN